VKYFENEALAFKGAVMAQKDVMF